MEDFLKTAEEWEDDMQYLSEKTNLDEDIKKIISKLISKCNNEDEVMNKLNVLIEELKLKTKEYFEQKKYDNEEMDIITESIDKLTNKKD